MLYLHTSEFVFKLFSKINIVLNLVPYHSSGLHEYFISFIIGGYNFCKMIIIGKQLIYINIIKISYTTHSLTDHRISRYKILRELTFGP